MMNGFYRWLDRKLNNQRLEKASLSTRDDQPRPIAQHGLDQYGLNFNVYRASGGYVIELRQYDRKNDRNNNSLHIITDDMELGAELSKIIIVETLRS